ncbi:hypothetical protein RvY_01061 [Ramazzottius varieornatus]|uniref:Receptor ligand binding region domain-containing protein n=1 Tax=Ramazzottius varieornatus TaxID=947166 RepID=A0A1D1UIK8_RAMVA|nr:hypothetical protein RvY_01061 [Ramazzottius varieornatus]
MYPYLIRFSFNTYSLWRIFLQMMDFYKWTNLVLIRDCCDFPKNTTTRGLINILADRNIEPYEVKFKAGSVSNTSTIVAYLKEASKYGRSKFFILTTVARMPNSVSTTVRSSDY